MQKVACILLFALLCNACSKKPQESTGDGAAPSDPDVLVEVNAESLTREILLRDVEVRIANHVKQGLTGAALDEERRRATINVVDQFVKRVLLMAAAEDAGIVVMDAEKAAAFDRIRLQLEREGKTLEDIMAESSLGADHMKNEVIVGLKISKYLAQELPGAQPMTDEALRAFKAQNASQLKRPETVRASHILLGFDAGDDESARSAKRKKIEDVRAEILAGAKFSDMARQHSSCPSRQRGGDLGEFPRGQMVKPFEAAAFGQKVGAVGPVIETKFGYHIILVKSHQKDAIMPDEQIRQALAKQNHQKRLVAHLSDLKQSARIAYSDEVMGMMRKR